MSIVDFSIKLSKTLFKKTLENHTLTRQSKKRSEPKVPTSLKSADNKVLLFWNTTARFHDLFWESVPEGATPDTAQTPGGLHPKQR